MAFMACPYCQKEATSYINLGNTYYFFKSNKICDFCKKPIEFNIKSLFIFYLVILPMIMIAMIILFIFIKYLAEEFFSDIVNVIFYAIALPLILLLSVLMNVAALKIANKVFKIRIFSKKAYKYV